VTSTYLTSKYYELIQVFKNTLHPTNRLGLGRRKWCGKYIYTFIRQKNVATTLVDKSV
jgi:hypothetical protein